MLYINLANSIYKNLTIDSASNIQRFMVIHVGRIDGVGTVCGEGSANPVGGRSGIRRVGVGTGCRGAWRGARRQQAVIVLGLNRSWTSKGGIRHQTIPQHHSLRGFVPHGQPMVAPFFFFGPH